MGQVNCSECGAQLTRKRYQILKYKTFYCNDVCRGLHMKVHADRKIALKIKAKKQREKIDTDPLYAARRAHLSAKRHQERKQDVEYRKRMHRYASAWAKRKAQKDPAWAERRRTYKRNWQRRRRAELVLV